MGIEILIPILIPLFIVILIILIRRYENTERMAMIEKGMEPGTMKPKKSYTGLKFALLAIGGGVGLMIGNVLEVSTAINEEVAYFSMLFLFGGLGLLIAHFIIEKKQEKEERDNKLE